MAADPLVPPAPAAAAAADTPGGSSACTDSESASPPAATQAHLWGQQVEWIGSGAATPHSACSPVQQAGSWAFPVASATQHTSGATSPPLQPLVPATLGLLRRCAAAETRERELGAEVALLRKQLRAAQEPRTARRRPRRGSRPPVWQLLLRGGPEPPPESVCGGGAAAQRAAAAESESSERRGELVDLHQRVAELSAALAAAARGGPAAPPTADGGGAPRSRSRSGSGSGRGSDAGAGPAAAGGSLGSPPLTPRPGGCAAAAAAPGEQSPPRCLQEELDGAPAARPVPERALVTPSPAPSFDAGMRSTVGSVWGWQPPQREGAEAPKRVSEWSAADLFQWLHAWGLGAYAGRLLADGLDGRAALSLSTGQLTARHCVPPRDALRIAQELGRVSEHLSRRASQAEAQSRASASAQGGRCPGDAEQQRAALAQEIAEWKREFRAREGREAQRADLLRSDVRRQFQRYKELSASASPPGASPPPTPPSAMLPLRPRAEWGTSSDVLPEAARPPPAPAAPASAVPRILAAVRSSFRSESTAAPLELGSRRGSSAPLRADSWGPAGLHSPLARSDGHSPMLSCHSQMETLQPSGCSSQDHDENWAEWVREREALDMGLAELRQRELHLELRERRAAAAEQGALLTAGELRVLRRRAACAAHELAVLREGLEEARREAARARRAQRAAEEDGARAAARAAELEHALAACRSGRGELQAVCAALHGERAALAADLAAQEQQLAAALQHRQEEAEQREAARQERCELTAQRRDSAARLEAAQAREALLQAANAGLGQQLRAGAAALAEVRRRLEARSPLRPDPDGEDAGAPYVAPNFFGLGVGAPVVLNVYSLPEAGLRAVGPLFGLGAYHSGVAVYGREYSFMGRPPEARARGDVPSGVYWTQPMKSCTHWKEAVVMGETHRTRGQVRQLLSRMRSEWKAGGYNVLSRNCNHFAQELCRQLVPSAEFPSFVNRAAAVGACVLPSAFLPAGPTVHPAVKGPE
eukprot:TRINITY_DN16427_c2_g1_i2.p1 TRINITY_DN16427_c2_g1~~TRINITY_DN16427_c2_g1_i2.p1  ORF type:complete len:1026 (+),score=291.73 TRINITY_DN16427_c2_g1_i2:96-3080(+)